MYANIRYPNGRESTIPVRDLARCTENLSLSMPEEDIDLPGVTNSSDPPKSQSIGTSYDDSGQGSRIPTASRSSHDDPEQCSTPTAVRRSARVIKAPDHYGWN